MPQRALAEVRAENRLPIFTGGTGLYFDALTDGLADIPAVPVDIRSRVQARRDEIGAEAFFAELRTRDPESAARLRASDTQRTLRAYEVFEATGRPLSSWQQREAAARTAGGTETCALRDRTAAAGASPPHRSPLRHDA